MSDEPKPDAPEPAEREDKEPGRQVPVVPPPPIYDPSAPPADAPEPASP